jgi:hypothetical protein
MSDDDLPPPPPKGAPKQVNLDDSDDDGLPPPPPKAASPQAPKQVNLEDSDDDGLPPPPPKGSAPKPKDDDDDDDLPPPPTQTNRGTPAKHSDPTDDDLPPPPSAATGNATASSSPPASPSTAPAAAPRHSTITKPADQAARGRTATVAKGAKVSALEKKGFLMKQKPTWPYASQKRWCVIQGRLMNYYETETSENPSGSLDLKGAELVDVSRDAKLPHSFGVTGPTGQLKGRVFTFSAMNATECQEWCEIIRAVSAEPSAKELHWFEKMAQGIY